MIGTQIIGAVLFLTSVFGIFGGQEATSSKSTVSAVKAEEPIVVTAPVAPDDGDIEEYVRTVFAEEPLLVEIAKCESTMMHTMPSGAVVRGRVNSKDVGLMQINEYYHLERAISLGFDIHTLDGNMAYARYLFAKEGSNPWNASSKCWRTSEAYKEFALSQ